MKLMLNTMQNISFWVSGRQTMLIFFTVCHQWDFRDFEPYYASLLINVDFAFVCVLLLMRSLRFVNETSK